MKAEGPLFIPTIIQQKGGVIQAFDPFSLLLQQRVIFLTGEIHEFNASLLIAQMLYLSSEKSSEAIHFYIQSPGGQLKPGLAIYDLMGYVRCPIATYGMGGVSSMATVLLAAGTKGMRYALPNATMMMHQPSGGAYGPADDVAIVAEEIKRAKTVLYDILSKHTGKSVEQLTADFQRDNFMNAQAACAYGIIDEVLQRK